MPCTGRSTKGAGPSVGGKKGSAVHRPSDLQTSRPTHPRDESRAHAHAWPTRVCWISCWRSTPPWCGSVWSAGCRPALRAPVNHARCARVVGPARRRLASLCRRPPPQTAAMQTSVWLPSRPTRPRPLPCAAGRRALLRRRSAPRRAQRPPRRQTRPRTRKTCASQAPRRPKRPLQRRPPRPACPRQSRRPRRRGWRRSRPLAARTRSPRRGSPRRACRSLHRGPARGRP